MNIVVHRGTHQIGGCVTEIQSNSGTRIIIDIGENLPTEKDIEETKLEVSGLTKDLGKEKVDAVFITHYHGDHIGLYNQLLQGIKIYIGEESKEIFAILQTHLAKYGKIEEKDLEIIKNFEVYKNLEPIVIQDITVTPIPADHSAYDAHMLLIEADGQKFLHTGDFRTHGQRGKECIKVLKENVKEIDCLICEGTSLSRKSQKIMTEEKLQEKAKKIFQKNKYSFVLCSSTNIDRISAIQQAALEADRLFMCDEYQKEILMYIDEVSTNDLYKFESKVQTYNEKCILDMKDKGFVMLVRDNWNFKQIMKKFPNSLFIYSQWEGYLEEKFKEKYAKLQKFVPKNHISLHTSGHANIEALEKVCKLVKPKVIIPIHSESPGAINRLKLKKCQIKIAKDGRKIMIKDGIAIEECKYTKYGNIPYSTYIDIEENDNGNQVKININKPCENMQSDKANFESIALMYKCLNPNANIKISFENSNKWNGKFTEKSGQINSYLRFLYRVINFRDAFPSWFQIADKNKKEILRFETLLNKELKENKVSNNIPLKKASFNHNKRRRACYRKQISSYAKRK